MEHEEFEFNPRLVDELFERRSSSEITETIAGLSRSTDSASNRSRYSNTEIAIERLNGHPDYRRPVASDTEAPFGRFRGRHIIGTGTHVLGGVFLGHRAREAIVVDETSSVLRSYVLEFIDRRFSNMRTRLLHGEIELEISPEGLLRAFVEDLPIALYDFTIRCLPFNERKTALVSRGANIAPDEELSLDVYLIAQTGVCRHMVLFLVAMFEMLSKMSYTKGRMFVCRCYIPNLFSHAWARFEQEGTESLILDPAQNYRGTLEHGGEMGKFVYDHEFAKLMSAD